MENVLTVSHDNWTFEYKYYYLATMECSSFNGFLKVVSPYMDVSQTATLKQVLNSIVSDENDGIVTVEMQHAKHNLGALLRKSSSKKLTYVKQLKHVVQKSKNCVISRENDALYITDKYSVLKVNYADYQAIRNYFVDMPFSLKNGEMFEKKQKCNEWQPRSFTKLSGLFNCSEKYHPQMTDLSHLKRFNSIRGTAKDGGTLEINKKMYDAFSKDGVYQIVAKSEKFRNVLYGVDGKDYTAVLLGIRA